jgi:hypothetical protein
MAFGYATARRRVDHNWTEARIELTRGMIREAEAKYLELANYTQTVRKPEKTD